MDSSLPGSSVLGDSPGKHTRVDMHFLLGAGDLLDPGIELEFPASEGRFFPTAPAATFIQIGISPPHREAPSRVPLCRGAPARKPTLCLRMRLRLPAHSLPVRRGDGCFVTVSTLYLTIHTLPPLPCASRADVYIHARLSQDPKGSRSTLRRSKSESKRRARLLHIQSHPKNQPQALKKESFSNPKNNLIASMWHWVI